MSRLSLGFLSYVNPFVHSGGGEMISRELLEAADRTGFEVQVASVWPTPSMPQIGQVDGWIVVDALNVPEHWTRWHQRILRQVPGTPARRYRLLLRRAISEGFIHLDNAYVDTCSKPYLPCNGETSLLDCPYEAGAEGFKQISSELYSQAEACFFLSPLHERVVQRLQPQIKKSYLLRPTLDPRRFSQHAERDIDWLYVGAIVDAKGAAELKQIDNLTVIPPKHMNVELPWAKTILSVDTSAIPAYYARAKRFVFRPRWPEPFGRVVAEAALSGCELHVNDRVGAMSFKKHPSDLSLYEGAAEEFWRTVAEIFGSPK